MNRQFQSAEECAHLMVQKDFLRLVILFYLEALSSSTLTRSVEHLCINLVNHIEKTTSGTILIHQMTLYFKVDRHFNLWLSLCTNIKFKDPEALWKTSMPIECQRSIEMKVIDDTTETNIAQIRKEVCLDDQDGLNPKFRVNQKQKICTTCHSKFLLLEFCLNLNLTKIQYVFDYYKRGKPE